MPVIQRAQPPGLSCVADAEEQEYQEWEQVPELAWFHVAMNRHTVYTIPNNAAGRTASPNNIEIPMNSSTKPIITPTRPAPYDTIHTSTGRTQSTAAP